MPEEIALVAEDFGADIVVHAVPVQGEGERVFASFRPFEQRTLVAFHAQLLRYVAQEELQTLELFDAAIPPPVVVRRGRVVQLQESDRRAGRATLEVRARLRAEALAREPPPLPSQLNIPRASGALLRPLPVHDGAIQVPRTERARIVSEVMAWHQYRRGTPAPSAELARWANTPPEVAGLVDARVKCLREVGAYPEAPLPRSGKLLEIAVDPVYFPPEPPHFDASGYPPRDFWCWRRDHSLVAWVPPDQLLRVKARIARAPVDYRWRPWP